MRVCVTGANGKLGRGVVEELLAHDHEVVATDVAGAPGHLSELAVPLDPLSRPQPQSQLRFRSTP